MEPSLRLLLVDDNANDRFLVLHELGREFPDLQALEATNREMLAAAIDQGQFDLVITDYEIRWTNGLDVLRAIRARWPACPVIMVTGTGSEEIAVTAMKSGLDDYVLKSVKHLHSLPTVVRLVQQRAKQKLALRELETRYQRLFNQVPIGLFRADAGGRFIDANAALLNLLDYPDNATFLAADPGHLYVDLDDRDEWQNRVSQTGIVRSYEMALKHRDGHVVWTSLNACLVRDESGQVQILEGSLEDVTHRKKIEAALCESEQRSRAISEIISDFTYSCFCRVDGTIHLDWIAGAFTRITGYSLAEIEEGGGWLRIILSEDHPVVDRQMQSARSGEFKPAEFRIRQRQGSVRWLRNHVRPVPETGDKGLPRFWGAALDITEAKS